MSTEQASRESDANHWFVPADVTTSSQNNGTTPKFAESQQAGLAAAIALARADAATALEPARSRLRLHRASSAAPADLEIAATFPAARATDVVRFRGDLAPLPLTETAEESLPADVSAKRTGARASRGLAYLQAPLLIAILTIQAVLSLRLMWSNTAFLDEATYLSAGHAEISHWLHGSPVPPYATFFSGAPVIYPPIAAVAANLGGLVAARILSLLCMLGATALLWSMTRKLFGMPAAVCGATLFAIMGPTLRLGAFATFDAMALLLLAAAAWCVVAAKDRTDSAFLLVAGTFLLALANATKYSTLLFDPSVIALAGLSIARTRGKKAAIARSGSVAVGVTALVGALLALGGPPYVTGVLSTTLARAPGGSSPRLILVDAWNWAGLVVSIAVLAVAVCLLRRKYRPELVLVSLLAASGVLAPLNQARIHTLISLSKHVDFGAWFAAAAAGYAVSLLTHIGRRRMMHFAMAAIVLVGIAVPASAIGRRQAWTMFQDWPSSEHLIGELASLTHQYPGRYLSEDYDVPSYYLEGKVPWQRWTGTWYFKYRPSGSKRTLFGLPAYRAAFNRHYFSLVILDFEATPNTDRDIAAYMRAAGGYQVVAVLASTVAQYTIWAYQQPKQSVQHGHN